jgi:hypothetical protein
MSVTLPQGEITRMGPDTPCGRWPSGATIPSR